MKPNDRSLATRAALFNAGRKLFSDKGFDVASVREIAAAANASQGAVTYHFGTKQELYAFVVESMVAPLADQLVAAASTTGAPLDRVELVVRRHFEYLTNHPELPRLMIRSLLDSGQLPATAYRHIGRLFTALIALIHEGQQDGTMRKGLPIVMAMGLMSPTLLFTLMQGVMLAMGSISPEAGADREAVLDNIVQAVRGGIAAPAAGAP
jgi:AcrR family transcriptional regulator